MLRSDFDARFEANKENLSHMVILHPWPERPALIAASGGGVQGYERRHVLWPGLAGPAQIYGRYNTKLEYKHGYDRHCAVNLSPLLGAEVLLRTVTVVLLRQE